MADEEPREGGGGEKEEQGGGGYDALSMNEVPAASTEEQSEAARRGGGVALLVIGVLMVAVLAALAGRFVLNPHPGEEAEGRLRERLGGLPAVQTGLVADVGYRTGDRVWIEFSPNIQTEQMMTKQGGFEFGVPGEEDRRMIGEATRAVMEALVAEQPDRDLYIDGYKGDDKIVEAEYRHRGTMVGQGGERLLDIVVRVAGEPKEGMGATYSQKVGTKDTD